MVDDWLSGMNEGCVSLAVCLDLSKCFDTITQSHDILIYKLHKYGFYGTVLNWMKSYFTDRVQCVRIDNNTSVFNIMRHCSRTSLISFIYKQFP